MSATNTPATVTIRTGFVNPSDLEVSWDRTDQGKVYTWVQVKHTACPGMTVAKYEALSFQDGLKMAQDLVNEHAARRCSMVPVAQVNVSEHGGMSFTATALEPAEGLKV